MNYQPNFETVKSAFYQMHIPQYAVNTELAFKGVTHIYYEAIKNMYKSGQYRKREAEFKKDFNAWLDRLDIRCVNDLIDNLLQNKVSIPSWIANKRFVIDYNEKGMLDLIKL